VYKVLALYSPPYTLSPPPPHHCYQPPQDLFHPPVLRFCKEKINDIFETFLFVETIAGMGGEEIKKNDGGGKFQYDTFNTLLELL
jgi:hypothetical protein